MSEVEPTFYLTSRDVEERDRKLAKKMGYGIFDKYDSEARSALAKKLRGKRVFLIDDEPVAFDFISREFIDGGAEVIVFETAEKALEAMKRQLPDAVVSDVALGRGMGGWGLAMAWDKLVST